MKTLLVICAFVFGAQALTKEQYETIMEKVHEVGAECLQKENATPEDLAQLVAHQIPPTTHSAKCILACFYEHYKMLKDDGSFDKQAAYDAFDDLKTIDADVHEKIMKVIDICDEKKQITDDRCETASLMASCSKTEAAAMGISREIFLAS